MRVFNTDYGPCIYHLICEDEVVYVGSTTDLLGRASTHLNDDTKVFDTIKYKEVNLKDMLIEEAKDIITLKPRYNRSLPPQDVFIQHSKLKELLVSINPDREFKRQIHLTRLKRIVDNIDIPMHYYQGRVYLEVRDIDLVYDEIVKQLAKERR